MSALDSLFNASPNANATHTALEAEKWRLFQYFSIYRLVIAGLAAAVGLIRLDIPPFGALAPGLFIATSLIYLAGAALGIVLVRRRTLDFETTAAGLSVIDVAALTILMHASGGLASGLGLLLVVAVAGNSFMLGPRMSLFLAATASVAILVENSWGFLTNQLLDAESYPQVGMFGIGLFATSGIAYFLSDRLRVTEALVEKRGVAIENLSQINNLIVERLQAGILVTGPDDRIRSSNHVAAEFLGLAVINSGTPLAAISKELAIEIEDWRQQVVNYKRKLLRTAGGYVLLPRFTPIGNDEDAGSVIFLEDTSILRQQAQQLKMAALARLTASIAHEIRNPLGAISNASQLLQESLAPVDENQRLLRIIDEQSRRMNTIIENVLQLGRRDQIRLTRIDLATWLERQVRHFCEGTGLPSAAFQITVRPGLSVCVDPDQLDQVVTNLFQNALRHSRPYAGQAQILISGGQLPEFRAFLDVKDLGAGVPPEIVDNIFDPFFTTTPRGTGLGLYIARELCESNGARLDYVPGEAEGARFRITFSRNEECLGLQI